MDLRKTALAKLIMALNLFHTTVPISIPPENNFRGYKNEIFASKGLITKTLPFIKRMLLGWNISSNAKLTFNVYRKNLVDKRMFVLLLLFKSISGVMFSLVLLFCYKMLINLQKHIYTNFPVSFPPHKA